MTTREKTYPFSLRLTKGERRELEKRAGTVSLGVYIRQQLLGNSAQFRGMKTRKRTKAPTTDRKAIAQILALLGRSGIAHSLNSLAEAAKSGSLQVTAETEAAIVEGVQTLKQIKSLLIRVQER